MKTLDEAQLAALLQDAQTLEQDGLGLKVARLANGEILKLFRDKRLLSSSLWAPPARRFADNARRLLQLGIPAPRILELLRIPARKLTGVRYAALPGETLRAHWRTLDERQREQAVERFGEFLGHLHQLGVYFRSLHLGNVLQLPDAGFGLIDLSDMKIARRALPAWLRRRNLQHILRYPEDAGWLVGQHRLAWLRGYRRSCGADAARRLEQALERYA